MDFSLTEEEKVILLRTARERIRAELYGDHPVYPEPTARLSEICGAFVSLHQKGRLRGCIGNIIGRSPLIDTVRSMAFACAFDDPRFPRLKKNELEKVEIEISVLSPLEKIDDPTIIETGKHGIYISMGFYAGVLLPQVAVEQEWDRENFLQHCCLKAGLPPAIWKDPACSIEIFTASVFQESGLLPG